MAYKQGWRPVLTADDTDVTFKVEGEEILALANHAGGSWELDLVLPDDSVVRLRTFDSNGTQQIFAPSGTRCRLFGGTQGATAMCGVVERGLGRYL